MVPTIASSTIAFEVGKIKCSASPTPSESSSVYFEIDGEEVEVVLISNPTLEEPTALATTGNISEIKTELPQTPARSTLSLQNPFNQIEESPSSSSEYSSSSHSSDLEPELYSPITEQCRRSSFSDDYLPTQTSSRSPAPTPCLQCFLAGLSCSLSESRRKSKSQTKITCCYRCTRNGECFCIFQVSIQKPEDRYNKRGSGDSDCAYSYHSEGVEREVVLEKVEELLETKRKKTRFELPKMTIWKRQMLKQVFEGGWVVNEEGKVECLTTS